jgi:hypothetical protein
MEGSVELQIGLKFIMEYHKGLFGTFIGPFIHKWFT